MPSETQLIEDNVLDAVGAYQSGDYPTIKAAADAVGAPAQRVSRRLRGIPSQSSRVTTALIQISMGGVGVQHERC